MASEDSPIELDRRCFLGALASGALAEKVDAAGDHDQGFGCGGYGSGGYGG